MNWQHLQAFVWLRWRLLANQWRRAGALNAILLTIVAIGALVTAIPLLIVSFLIGQFAIPRAAPEHLLYAWDVVIVAFLFFWSIGLLTESPAHRADVALEIPALARLGQRSVPDQLCQLALPPEPDHFLAGDARVQPGIDRYQGLFPAARFADAGGFLVDGHRIDVSISGLAGRAHEQPPPPPDGDRGRDRDFRVDRSVAEPAELLRALGCTAADRPCRETVRRNGGADSRCSIERIRSCGVRAPKSRKLTEEHQRARQRADREMANRVEETARIANMVLPVGWLPLGVMAMAEGRIMPAMLGLLGMTLIGTGSLYRAYRTTIGLYQGQTSNAKRRPAPARAARSQRGRRQASRANSCSKRGFPDCRSRFRPSRWEASAHWCGRRRRR